MAENFDLIFGQNASQQYAWNDTDYQNGWETIGNIPPTAAQFDALQRRSDTKMKELNDELTPLVNADTADSRQPSTAYSVDDIKYSPLLPTGWLLTCTVGGITSAGELVLPTPIAENDTVTDGTVTWEIHKIGTGNGGDGVPLGAIIAYSANGELPSGYLLCDGSAVSRTMFADLFACIGTTYGAGDGSTTFNVPDYNTAKRFAQGDTVAGQTKNAGLPNITGTATVATKIESSAGAFVGALSGSGYYSGAASAGGDKLDIDASLSNPIYGNSTTVQPDALTTRYIIKAFDGQTPDSALIDITQYAQELAGKANRQLSNLDTANLACHVVVDSYYDATTGDWWREYDDGWIEQGGHITSGTLPAIGLYQITLLKAMADNGYFFAGNYGYVDNIGWVIKKSDSTATVVNISQYNNGSNAMHFATYGLVWFICGMGANN